MGLTKPILVHIIALYAPDPTHEDAGPMECIVRDFFKKCVVLGFISAFSCYPSICPFEKGEIRHVPLCTRSVYP